MAVTYRRLGNTYHELGNISQAIEASAAAARFDPDSDDTYVGLSWYYSFAGRHADSLRAAQLAVEKGGRQPSAMAYTNMCRALNDLNRYNEARDACQEALRRHAGSGNANDGETNFYLGRNCAQSSRNTATCRPYFTKAIQWFNANLPNMEAGLRTDGWYLLGNCYAELENYAEAANAYRNAVARRPKFFQARYNLGLAYLLQGQVENARGQYRELLSLDAESADKLLRQIHARSGKPGGDEN